MNPGVYSVHSEIDLKSYAHKRKVLSYAFSEKALRDMEVYIFEHIRAFCDYLGSSTQPQNMADRCDYLTFDVLGDLCFGKSFEMQEKSDNRFVPELICKNGKRLSIVGLFPIPTI
jgi:cytochrome P450